MKGKNQYGNPIFIEKELLLSLYWGNQYSFLMISKIFNTKSSVIYKKMKVYDIPTRKGKYSHIFKKKPNSGSFKKGMIPFHKDKTAMDDPRIPHGESHGMWKNNSTLVNYGKNGIRLQNSHKEKIWRIEVYKRDNYTCQICHERSRKGHSFKINAHHIKSWRDYPEERFNIDNGITLCQSYHKWVHHLNPIDFQ